MPIDAAAARATITCVAEGFEFDAPTGVSLMRALKDTGFDIEAACEGELVCATCHVRLTLPPGASLAAPGAEENALLSALHDRTADSRLACQIPLTADLAGLSIQLVR